MWKSLVRQRRNVFLVTSASSLLVLFSTSKPLVKSEKSKNVSIYAARGPRAAMEDRWFVSDDLKFFAVYDGHGGHRVADHAQKRLYKTFVQELTKAQKLKENPESEETPNDVEAALMTSFETVSEDILSIPSMDFEGSTAVVVCLADNDIITANLGDSRAILCRGSKAKSITIDHKPDSISELKRIESLGGKVKWHGYLGPDKLPVPGMGAYRINGNLAVSRAFGDRLERPFVSSVPEIQIIKRKHEEDSYIVLASDGLWDVMTSQDVVDFVKQIMTVSYAFRGNKGIVSPQSSKKSEIRSEMDKRREHMAQFLVEEALRRGSADNVTAVVAWLR